MKFITLEKEEQNLILNRFNLSLERLSSKKGTNTLDELINAYEGLFKEHEATKIFYEREILSLKEDVENLKKQIK